MVVEELGTAVETGVLGRMVRRWWVVFWEAARRGFRRGVKISVKEGLVLQRVVAVRMFWEWGCRRAGVECGDLRQRRV